MSESDKEIPDHDADYVREVQLQVMEILNRVKEELGTDMPVEIEVVNVNEEEKNE